MIVTSYGTGNQPGTPGQIQGLGNLNGHISYDGKVSSCLGKYLKGNGAQNIWTVRELTSLKTLLTGHHFKWSLKEMLLPREVLKWLRWSDFF